MFFWGHEKKWFFWDGSFQHHFYTILLLLKITVKVVIDKQFYCKLAVTNVQEKIHHVLKLKTLEFSIPYIFIRHSHGIYSWYISK
jgi:hypothetical protein